MNRLERYLGYSAIAMGFVFIATLIYAITIYPK